VLPVPLLEWAGVAPVATCEDLVFIAVRACIRRGLERLAAGLFGELPTVGVAVPLVEDGLPPSPSAAKAGALVTSKPAANSAEQNARLFLVMTQKLH